LEKQKADRRAWMTAPQMAVPKDPRRVPQRVPTKDLTTASMMVLLSACLKAHSRELQTAQRTAFLRAQKMVRRKALSMAWTMAPPMAEKMAEP
jgi:hypothetical protein